MDRKILFEATSEDLRQMIGEVVRNELEVFRKAQLPKYWTRENICTEFGVSLQTVHRWTREGLLKPQKVKGRVLFLREEVEKLAFIPGKVQNAEKRKGKE